VKRTDYIAGIAGIAGAGLLLAMGGCGKDSPQQTQANVTRAEDSGEKRVADATEDAADKMAESRHDLTNTQLEVAHDGLDAAHSVAFAKAEAAHKVALARCDGDSGDVRKACKELADTQLAAAKASANATRIANDPKS
jgi:hypothetical protein